MDPLQYWILDENKKPLYVNSNGLVDFVPSGKLKPDGQPAHLKYLPKGWNENLVKYGRDVELLGTTTEFTIPMDFTGDGAEILKYKKWTMGSEGIVYLVINNLNKKVFPDKYELFHFCEIDLSKVKQRRGYVTATAIEGGLNKIFKANRSTTFELSIDTDVKKKLLYLDGATLVQNAKFLAFNGLLQNENGNHTVNLEILSTEAISEIGAVSCDRGRFNNSAELNAQNNWFLTTGAKPVEATFKYNIGFTVSRAPGIPSTSSDGAVLLLRTFDSRSTSSTPTEFFELSIYGGSNSLYQHHTLNDTVTVTIPPYRKCFLCQEFAFVVAGVPSYATGSTADGATLWNYDSTTNDTFELDYTYTAPPTYCECITAKRVAELLLEKMAPSAGYVLSSDLLNELEEKLFITSGMSIRKYGAKSVLKTSFDDLWKSLRRYGIGVGIEGHKLVIERHPYFFRSTSTVDFGEVNNWSVEDALDLVHNTSKWGYPLAELGKVNGRDDVHVTLKYKSPITRTVKELDMVSVYHASFLYIETTRIDLNGKDTTDSPVDNTGFMFAVKKGINYTYYEGDITAETNLQIMLRKNIQPAPQIGDLFTISGTGVIDGTYPLSGFNIVPGSTRLSFASAAFTTGDYSGTITVASNSNYSLDRPAFDSVVGLRHPEDAFNIPLTGKRAILENSPYLHSVHDFMEDKLYEFTSGERNSTLSTTILGVTIAESQNEVIGSFKPQLFKPYYFNVEVAGFTDYQKGIRQNMYDRIKFKINGLAFSGYMFDGDFNPNTQGKTTVKLLAAPDTDYSKLRKI